MGSTESELSKEVVFDILSSPRRRYVLYYLRTTEEPIKLTDLAEKVAAWENDTTPDQITDQERKRVYVSLYQTHIPRLDEATVVQYDQETGYVSLAPAARQIDQYLVSSEERLPWQYLYLGLAAIGLAVLGLTVVEIGPLSLIPQWLTAAAVIIAFAITALAHSVMRVLERRTVPSELRS